MHNFLLVSLIANGFFTVIWKRTTWLNVALKLFFLGMMLWSFGLLIKNF